MANKKADEVVAEVTPAKGERIVRMRDDAKVNKVRISCGAFAYEFKKGEPQSIPQRFAESATIQESPYLEVV